MTLPLSVIMPTYNRASLISRMIESVLAQPFNTFEFLIVDDGSTDATKEVVMGYSDSRIIYHRLLDNQGVSVARNYGIQNARGTYISFVDSDDTLAGDLFGEMYRHTVQYNADICMSWYRKDIPEIEITLVEKKARKYIRSCWSGLYRRQFLLDRKIQFPEGVQCGEDLYFLQCAMVEADIVLDIKQQARYAYSQRNAHDRLVKQPDQLTHMRRMLLLLKHELQRRSPEHWQRYMHRLVVHYQDTFKDMDLC